MVMTYSYDPVEICGGGKDQMRFELGDTLTDGGADTCALADEEYTAIIENYTEGSPAKRWKHAKYDVLSAIVYKLSYQVDTKIDVLTYNFSDRAERWKKLLDELSQEISANESVPSMNAEAMNKPSYFFGGMLNNPHAKPDALPPYWGRR
jgi:hypothetical protein